MSFARATVLTRDLGLRPVRKRRERFFEIEPEFVDGLEANAETEQSRRNAFTLPAGARLEHGVHAPATIGHPEFERAFRAHANTVENMILYLPLLWMAAFFYGGQIPFWVGLIWIVGRVVYIAGYAMNDARKRGPGALLCYISLAGLATLVVLGFFGIQLMPQA